MIRGAFLYSLIILSVNFEEALGMGAGGAQLGCLGANGDMTAVAALPNGHACLLEDLHSLHILQQLAVALFMVLFH